MNISFAAWGTLHGRTWARVGLACGLIAALLGGCRTKAKWPWQSMGTPRFAGLPWDFFQWKTAPPVEIDLGAFPGLDLSSVNGDHFFPSDARRILIAPDAQEIGLFRRPPTEVNLFQGQKASAPDGQHALLVRNMQRAGGYDQLVDVLDADDVVMEHWWSIGRFTEFYWSPDGRHFGFNERGAGNGDRRRFSIIALDRSGLVEASLRGEDFEALLRNFRVGEPESEALRGWVSDDVVVLWFHGDFDRTTQLPRWGYEVLVDLGAPREQINARIVRAFTKR